MVERSVGILVTIDVPAERTPDMEKGVVGESLDIGAEFEERGMTLDSWVFPVLGGCDVDRSGSGVV